MLILNMKVMVIETKTHFSDLKDIIIDLQEFETRKVQLTIAITIISSKDAYEQRVMHSKGNNKKTMIYDNANDIASTLFKPLLSLSRYQNNLETSLSDFIFHTVQLSYYKCHKGGFRSGGSNINSPDWIKQKKKQ